MVERSAGRRMTMRDGRKQFSGDFKMKVAVEAIKGHRTVAEIASEYEVHPNQVTQWKKDAIAGLPEVLSDKRQKRKEDHEGLVAQLYQQIGQLKVELDWLKKKVGFVR
jgi:transposase-like protein